MPAISMADGRVIPAGAKIIISYWSIHHDKSVYPESERWNPDHFHPSKTADRNPYSFVPFGVGSRSCIGKLITLKIVEYSYIYR